MQKKRKKKNQKSPRQLFHQIFIHTDKIPPRNFKANLAARQPLWRVTKEALMDYAGISTAPRLQLFSHIRVVAVACSANTQPFNAVRRSVRQLKQQVLQKMFPISKEGSVTENCPTR